MPAPSLTTVEGVLARFHTDLYAAKTPHDRQAVRDRYLGRKNSVVAEWMERPPPASPPAEKTHRGQLPTPLKRELEARWTTYVEWADASAVPADAVDVTLP